MQITIIDSGFVSYETMKPIGYAGEINSRRLYITHPHFKDVHYQVLALKSDTLYTLGVNDDGVVLVPPSLLRTAGEIQCEFVAVNNPDSMDNTETDSFVFKSMPFTLTVAAGLNIAAGVTPVPPYEELQNIQKENEAAKKAVQDAIDQNNKILQAINEAIAEARQHGLSEDIKEAATEEYKELVEQLSEDEAEHFEEVIKEVSAEYTDRHKEQLETQYKAYRNLLASFVRDELENTATILDDMMKSFIESTQEYVAETKADTEAYYVSYRKQLETLFGEQYDSFVKQLVEEINKRYLQFTRMCDSWQEEHGCTWDFDEKCDFSCYLDVLGDHHKASVEPFTQPNIEINDQIIPDSESIPLGWEVNDLTGNEDDVTDTAHVYPVNDLTGDDSEQFRVPSHIYGYGYEHESFTLREVGRMTKPQLAKFVACMFKHLMKDVIDPTHPNKPCQNIPWYNMQPTHSMTTTGNIIGG